MKRVTVLFLVAILFALAPAATNAQGLFGAGLPSFGGFSGAPSICGDKCGGPTAGTTLYVGWMDDPNGVTAKFNFESGIPPFLLTEARQKYRVSGLWLGVTQTCPLTENIGIIGSGWYLIPANHRSSEEYVIGPNAVPFPATDWGTKTQWWFVDGLLALGGSNAQLLAGVRYDYLTTAFNDRSLGGAVVVGGTADLISSAIIPLVGIQLAQSGANGNLLFRIIGMPTLPGTFRYRENVLGSSFEGKGNYNGGYFLEAFGEYGFRMGGMADVGIFARYNVTQGKSLINFDFLPGGASSDWRLAFYRSSWTLGGKFALSFSIPYM